MKKEPNAAPTPTVAADAAAPSDTCAHDYLRSDRVCVECGEKAAKPDERAAEWVTELRRAHVYLDQGKPFFSGKDCTELADLLEMLAARATAPQATVKGDEPRLDKPAQVGNGRFGVGVKWSTVIGAAQRHHEYMNTPEKEAERIAKGNEFWGAFRAAAPQAGALTDEQRAVITDAMRSVAENADGIRAGCATGDDWPDAEDKAHYDHQVRLIERLRALLDVAPAEHGIDRAGDSDAR